MVMGENEYFNNSRQRREFVLIRADASDGCIPSVAQNITESVRQQGHHDYLTKRTKERMVA